MLIGAYRSLIKSPDVVAAASYTANAVLFDGTDRIKRGAALTGAAASKVGILSFWWRSTATTGEYPSFLEPGATTGPGLNVYKWGGNDKIRVLGKDIGGSDVIDLYSSNTYLNGMGWSHLLVSWDVASGLAYMYINDAADLSASPTINNANIAWATPTEWTIGARADGSIPCKSDIADFYLNTASYLDITNSTNRRKFITAGLKPVDLGSDGSTPTGSAPIIFLKNSLATWPTNVGTGGGFTLTGTLTSSSSSPSD